MHKHDITGAGKAAFAYLAEHAMKGLTRVHGVEHQPFCFCQQRYGFENCLIGDGIARLDEMIAAAGASLPDVVSAVRIDPRTRVSTPLSDEQIEHIHATFRSFAERQVAPAARVA